MGRMSLKADITLFWKTVCLQITKAAPKIALGLIIFLVAVVLAVIIKFCIVRLANHSKRRVYLFRMIGSTVMIVVMLVGLVMALGTMGVNVSALVASLGLAGFAIGFALKDTLSNLMAGFMVIFYQPFKAGDFIVINNMEGQVINVDLRYTVIKTNSEQTYVPNATILSNPVTVKNTPPSELTGY